MLFFLLSILYLTHINSFSVSFPGYNKIGAIINNIDIKSITSQDKNDLKRLFNVSPLLLFKDQKITPKEHFEFCKIFDKDYNDDIIHPFNDTAIPEVPQIALRGNCDINQLYGLENIKFKKILNREYNYIWHQDLVGSSIIPPKVVSLYMLKTPNYGGETLFASMEQAYDNLDRDLKKIVDKINVIYIDSIERLIDSTYDYKGFIRYDKECHKKYDTISIKPLVTYSNNKQNKRLTLSPERFVKFDNYSTNDSNNLYREIMTKYIIIPENTVSVQWEKNDLLIFNNRKLIHTASPTKEYEDKDRLFTLCFLGTNSPLKSV